MAEEAKQQKPKEPPAKPEETKKEKKKPDAKKPEAKAAEKEEGGIKNRVRVAGVILDGNLEVKRALTGIKGVGPQLSRSIPEIIGVNEKEKLRNLSEQQILKIEETIQNLDKHFPPWMLNRRGEAETGSNRHLTGPDLDIALREDINLIKRIRSYKGVRHSLGLPVRGQRTRSTFRKGPAVGVARKKVQAVAAAAATEKKEQPKK